VPHLLGFKPLKNAASTTHFEDCFSDPLATYATYQNCMNDFGRESPRDQLCKIGQNPMSSFRRDVRCMTDEGGQMMTGHNSSPCLFLFKLNASCFGQ